MYWKPSNILKKIAPIKLELVAEKEAKSATGDFFCTLDFNILAFLVKELGSFSKYERV